MADMGLPRFLITERDPSDGPLFKAAEAWSDFAYNFLVSHDNILAIVSQASRHFMFRTTSQSAQASLQISTEAALTERHPEFIAAANGLRKALDNMQGLHIMWNHYQRGEVIGLIPTPITDNVTIYQPERAPTTYPEEDGFVRNNVIGPDPLGNYGAWLEIANAANQDRGIHFSLYEMFAIRLAE